MLPWRSFGIRDLFGRAEGISRANGCGTQTDPRHGAAPVRVLARVLSEVVASRRSTGSVRELATNVAAKATAAACSLPIRSLLFAIGSCYRSDAWTQWASGFPDRVAAHGFDRSARRRALQDANRGRVRRWFEHSGARQGLPGSSGLCRRYGIAARTGPTY